MDIARLSLGVCCGQHSPANPALGPSNRVFHVCFLLSVFLTLAKIDCICLGCLDLQKPDVLLGEGWLGARVFMKKNLKPFGRLPGHQESSFTLRHRPQLSRDRATYLEPFKYSRTETVDIHLALDHEAALTNQFPPQFCFWRIWKVTKVLWDILSQNHQLRLQLDADFGQGAMVRVPQCRPWAFGGEEFGATDSSKVC